jgi:hypothetical protein
MCDLISSVLDTSKIPDIGKQSPVSLLSSSILCSFQEVSPLLEVDLTT